MSDWAPVCDSCGGFDTLTWREPQARGTGSMAAPGAEMLPLLVGAPKPQPSAPVVEDVVRQDEPVRPVVEPEGKTSKVRRVEIADVAPGMVPRESDYVTVEPAHTITTPEPVPVRVEVLAADPQPSVRPAPAVQPEPTLIRPDVLPPEDADWTEGKTRP